MPPSKVIRIDDQVWAELQKRARPLEDTPNSVLRRVFGLGDEESDERIAEVPEGIEQEGTLEPRVARLLDSVRRRVGETPQVSKRKKVYSFSSEAQKVVAFIRPQKERIRIAAERGTAELAGVGDWDRERPKGWFGKPDVRWYLADGDEGGYERGAEVLEKLWRLNSPQ